MVGILCGSILSAITMTVLLRLFGGQQGKEISAGSSVSEGDGVIIDGAARREVQERGLGRFWFRR
jgi:hypothetical protein